MNPNGGILYILMTVSRTSKPRYFAFANGGILYNLMTVSCTSKLRYFAFQNGGIGSDG